MFMFLSLLICVEKCRCEPLRRYASAYLPKIQTASGVILVAVRQFGQVPRIDSVEFGFNIINRVFDRRFEVTPQVGQLHVAVPVLPRLKLQSGFAEEEFQKAPRIL